LSIAAFPADFDHNSLVWLFLCHTGPALAAGGLVSGLPLSHILT
jgi:hypothetical protein